MTKRFGLGIPPADGFIKIPSNLTRDDGMIHVRRHPDGCYMVVDADDFLRGPMKHSAALAIKAWRRSGYIARSRV